MKVPFLPQHGGETTTVSLTISLGGSATNTAIVLAGMGMKVQLIGCVGADDWAEIVLTSLKKADIDTCAIQRYSKVSTAVLFNAITPDGERTMFTYRGANMHTNRAHILPKHFENAAWLHVSGYAFLSSPQREAVWHAVELAQQHHIPISLDTALYPAQHAPDQLKLLLPKLKLCILSNEEASAFLSINPISGSAIEIAQILSDKLLAFGTPLIVFKLGAQGCFIVTAQYQLHIPALPIQPIDTTGAGDAFSAGIIAQCLKQSHVGEFDSNSLLVMGQCANTLGACAAQVMGAGLNLMTCAKIC
jgi:ribokinase